MKKEIGILWLTQVVAYAMRSATTMHAMERETLAAIHAIRTWKLYLFKPFELVTDNRGVT